ncbi:MAG: S9 family peptidase [Ignavibacteria bacterium]|nr:S9 family peptidase [Ignavibacteria bacterium]
MKKTIILVTLFFCVLLVSGLYSQVREIPVRDFFKNPEKTGFRISPDGNYLSYLTSYETRLNIFIQDIETGDIKRVTSEKDRDIIAYLWKGSNKILYLQDTGGDENYKLYSVNRDGTDLKLLTPPEKVRVELVDELEENPNEILIGMNQRDARIFDVYKLNVNTGEMTMVAENPGNISDWVTDHNGIIRIAIATDGVNRTILYRDDEKKEFSPVLTTNFKETLNPVFFTFDNEFVYAVSNLDRDKAAIVKYDIKNAKELELIYENPEVDVTGLSYSKKRKVLTVISYITDKRQIKFLDDETARRYNRVKTELGEYEIAGSGMNDEEDKWLVRTYSDKSLGAYYLFDIKKDKLTKIAEVSPWINENEMTPMKPVKYNSRDGLTIHGYLTLPVGIEPKNLPVVVNVHGGPWARDRWGYNPEVQFLANRGYAVLQVNFRGSTGYGKKFWEASFKQWGLKMQDDITDGVQWLIDQGIADPTRVAIYGGSYGGYATLAGLAYTPDLYACGVDYVGVSNLFTFMKTIPPYWELYLKMFYEMVGDPVKDSLQFVATSPALNADKIKAPLFVAQGKRDPRVNVNESDQMVEAMKKRGIDVEYMVKDNEGHGFLNEENRFDFYGSMEKFLAKYLKK